MAEDDGDDNGDDGDMRARERFSSGGDGGGGSHSWSSTDSSYWIGVYSTQSTAPQNRSVVRLWGAPQSNEIVNGRSRNFDNAFAMAYVVHVCVSLSVCLCARAWRGVA